MVAKKGFVLRNVLDEYLLMPTGDILQNSQGMIILNEVSADIWKIIEKPCDVEDIIHSMLEIYDVSEDQLRHDVLETLNSFRQ